MPKLISLGLSTFPVDAIDTTDPEAEKVESDLRNGVRRDITIDGNGRVFSQKSRAILGGYKLFSKGNEIPVPCWKESPMETVERKQREDAERWKGIQEWSKANATLVLVQTSPRRYSVFKLEPASDSVVGEGRTIRAFREGKPMLVNVEYDAALTYIRENGEELLS